MTAKGFVGRDYRGKVKIFKVYAIHNKLKLKLVIEVSKILDTSTKSLFSNSLDLLVPFNKDIDF